MPFITTNNTRQFYRVEGQPGKPMLVLSHCLGADHAMWAPQMADFLSHFQVLRYDTRGHGASDASKGDYAVELLGSDVLSLADTLGVKQFAFCGLSMGGAVGEWLAIHAPERLTGLVLANTSPQFGPRSNWEARIKAVREGGMAVIVDVAMGRFFSPEVLARNAYATSVKSIFLSTDATGYVGCCAALRDMDYRDSLRKIRVPTLLIVGDRDVSTPWEGHGELLARDIPGARVVRLPSAHLSNIERPHSFTSAVLEFLRLSSDHAATVLEAGFTVRREMLGDAHVDRAIAGATDFNREFQDLITRYAWGTIWTRPGLDLRTRRLLVLATMAALGRWEEFSLHLRAGLAHELEPCDLKELLLQTSIYAGVPAANTGFHLATEEMERAKQK
ncbi:MAG TPA: 3-oxoadipate enol-lactonase [Terriglobales bacterium]|nr:3-oxoadipate enol-lactonase [Terriglobales bacterium]